MEPQDMIFFPAETRKAETVQFRTFWSWLRTCKATFPAELLQAGTVMRPFILASEVQGSLHCKVAFVQASEAGTVQFCVVSPLAWERQGILLRKAVTVYLCIPSS